MSPLKILFARTFFDLETLNGLITEPLTMPLDKNTDIHSDLDMVYINTAHGFLLACMQTIREPCMCMHSCKSYDH